MFGVYLFDCRKRGCFGSARAIACPNQRPRRLVNTFQLVEQFLFQTLSRSFLDGAPLSRDRFLFCSTLATSARVDLAWQMRNLWTACAHMLLFRLRVRLHSNTMTALLRGKKGS